MKVLDGKMLLDVSYSSKQVPMIPLPETLNEISLIKMCRFWYILCPTCSCVCCFTTLFHIITGVYADWAYNQPNGWEGLFQLCGIADDTVVYYYRCIC